MSSRTMTTPQATPPMCSTMFVRSNCMLVPPERGCLLVGSLAHESRKFTVTVMITGTGTPFSRVGV